MADMTEQQRALRQAAQALLQAIQDNVPSSTVHYVVEGAKRSCEQLIRVAENVKTADVPVTDSHACQTAGEHQRNTRHNRDECPVTD